MLLSRPANASQADFFSVVTESQIEQSTVHQHQSPSTSSPSIVCYPRWKQQLHFQSMQLKAAAAVTTSMLLLLYQSPCTRS
jgi:hypothetical protein